MKIGTKKKNYGNQTMAYNECKKHPDFRDVEKPVHF